VISEKMKMKYIKIICGILIVAVSALLSCDVEGELLNARKASIPVITINTQPTETTNVTAGSITGSLTVSASVTEGASLSYQWYTSTSLSNNDGTEFLNATSASLTIPTTLIAGTHYYFCEVRATDGATSVRSNVATVNVQAPTPVITVNSHPTETTN